MDRRAIKARNDRVLRIALLVQQYNDLQERVVAWHFMGKCFCKHCLSAGGSTYLKIVRETSILRRRGPTKLTEVRWNAAVYEMQQLNDFLSRPPPR